MKILIIRYGAYGDNLIITPVVRALKEAGHEIYLNVNGRGIEIFKNNPHVDHFVPYEDNLFEIDQLEKFWPELAKELGVDKTYNFTQTVEVALAMHPATKEYYESPDDIKKRCEKNYYEYAMEYAEVKSSNYRPEMFFLEKEEQEAYKYIKNDCYNILWCVKGSGIHKYYPWTPFIINELYDNCRDINIITVGDNDGVIVEDEVSSRATKLCGKIPFRTSALLTKLSDLVVSTDTGVLHASGCYDTEKIALLAATSKENITKHFTNCTTIQSDVPCSPCYSLIYEYNKQGCPIDENSGCVACMGGGIDPNEIFSLILSKYKIWEKFKSSKTLIGGLAYGC